MDRNRRRAGTVRQACRCPRCHPRAAHVGGDQRHHQSGGQAATAARAAEPPLGAADAAQPAGTDVVVIALRAFGECRGVRGGSRAGKSAAGLRTLAACRFGGAVPGGDRRPLPRRRLRGIWDRCGTGSPGCARGAADRDDGCADGRPAAGGNTRTARGRGCCVGGQSGVRRWHRAADPGTGAQSAAAHRDRRAEQGR
ncbi:Uncharacterised protein [Mycobacteroides abscessus subsp. massiliense]|nr:Uncharacterised protein [Mycobacteroides abscessus subsp. massiliense]